MYLFSEKENSKERSKLGQAGVWKACLIYKKCFWEIKTWSVVGEKMCGAYLPALEGHTCREEVDSFSGGRQQGAGQALWLKVEALLTSELMGNFGGPVFKTLPSNARGAGLILFTLSGSPSAASKSRRSQTCIIPEALSSVLALWLFHHLVWGPGGFLPASPWLLKFTPCFSLPSSVAFTQDLHSVAFTLDLHSGPSLCGDWLYSGSDRFKGFDLIDRVPGELWAEVCNIVQEALIKTIPKKKKRKMPKMVVWGGLINSRERKRSKRQRKGKIYPNECRVPEKSKERWESLPKWTVQRNRAKPLKWERLEISSRKLEIPREHYMQRWAQ